VSASPSVVVAGAGVFGAAVALQLARDGARVVLADPAERGDNASGAAGGMIAPAFEALLDPVAEGHFAVLRGARDLWPSFAGPLSDAMDLRCCGAIWLTLPGDPPDLAEARATGLAAMGAQVEAWSASRVAERVKHLAPGLGPGVFTPEDWRLAPMPALAALLEAGEAAGVRRVRAAVDGFARGRAALSGGERIAADILVVATGAEPAGLAPELALLSPIKGQILRFAQAAFAATAPTLRCALGYAAGGVDGLCVGATMEPGLSDRTVDPQAAGRLAGLARRLSPDLADAPRTPLAAVRAASADGFPLVGLSAQPGVLLAVGARRNGWLLAPLVARAIADHIAGRDPSPEAARMDPGRFAAG
jgi:glycine oxidase